MSHEHVRQRAGESAPFHFDDRWTVEAGREPVWAVLEEVEAWPQWWPGLAGAHWFEDRIIPGSRADIQVRTPIGMSLCFTIAAEHVDAPRRISFSAHGDLRGEGVWTLTPHGSSTHIDSLWCVTTTRPVIRALRPLSGLMHALVMRAGERGLRRRLSGRACA